MEHPQDIISRTPLSTITNTCSPSLAPDLHVVTPKSSKRICMNRPSSLKKLAVDMVMSGQRKAAVCRELGIPESTLRGWIKVVDSSNSSSRGSPAPSLCSSSGASSFDTSGTDSEDNTEQPLDLSHFKNDEAVMMGLSCFEDTESFDEAIEHAEKFYKWIEQGNEPDVTPMQMLQLAALVHELRSYREHRQQLQLLERVDCDEAPVDYSMCSGC